MAKLTRTQKRAAWGLTGLAALVASPFIYDKFNPVSKTGTETLAEINKAASAAKTAPAGTQTPAPEILTVAEFAKRPYAPDKTPRPYVLDKTPLRPYASDKTPKTPEEKREEITTIITTSETETAEETIRRSFERSSFGGGFFGGFFGGGGYYIPCDDKPDTPPPPPPAVPEPATWGMMIGGFALAGAALRRRRISYANSHQSLEM